EPGTASSTRGTVLARQVMIDSAVEVVHRPLATGWHFVTETADHVGALTAGEFGKRVVLPLHGSPDPLTPSSETLDLAEFEQDLERLTGETLQPADVQLQL